MSIKEPILSDGAVAPWDFRVPSTLRNPKTLEPMIEGFQKQQALLNKIAETKQAVFGASAEQIKIAYEQLQRTIAPLLEWAQKPRVRSELFMYRRSIIGDKFSKMVVEAIEKLFSVLTVFVEFISPKRIIHTPQRRAQIMSIRGLALSCAPNFTPNSDFNLLSRSHLGIA